MTNICGILSFHSWHLLLSSSFFLMLMRLPLTHLTKTHNMVSFQLGLSEYFLILFSIYTISLIFLINLINAITIYILSSLLFYAIHNYTLFPRILIFPSLPLYSLLYICLQITFFNFSQSLALIP